MTLDFTVGDMVVCTNNITNLQKSGTPIPGLSMNKVYKVWHINKDRTHVEITDDRGMRLPYFAQRFRKYTGVPIDSFFVVNK